MRRFRIGVTSLFAVLSALVHVATGRARRPRVVLQPGDLAPDFELPGSDGRTYRLRDYKGCEPVILAWFPKAFTGGCAAECRSLAAGQRALSEAGVRCFAVSVDLPRTNREFAKSLMLDYPVLSDSDRRVARRYGVLGLTGFASRWTFYIGRDGRIAGIDKNVRPASHGRDVAARLNSQAGAERQAGA